MRYLRHLILGAIAVALIIVALANRDMVTLNLLPEPFAGLIGTSLSLQLPLFLVIFAGIAGGLLIGFFWEWLREMKLRSAANKGQREVTRLTREVKRLKGQKNEGKDEILALLDDA